MDLLESIHVLLVVFFLAAIVLFGIIFSLWLFQSKQLEYS